MQIQLQEPCLVVLVGPSGAGKSTFAGRHFRATEVLSSDRCRGIVCDDENNQAATDDAFELLHLILAKRMARRRTTVVDATNVKAVFRARLLEAAAKQGIRAVALVFLLTEEECMQRNEKRLERRVPDDTIRDQMAAMEAELAGLKAEGFGEVYEIRNPDKRTVLRDASYS